MTIITTTKTVTFRKPFVLGDIDEVLPAGAYTVETDAELLEGISFPVYRRKMTVLNLQAIPGDPGFVRTVTIDPNELDAALKRDQAPEEGSASREITPKISNEKTRSCHERDDREAIERGEGEGMMVH